MARVLSFLIRYFSNYYTLHRSDLVARAAPLDPRLLIKMYLDGKYLILRAKCNILSLKYLYIGNTLTSVGPIFLNPFLAQLNQ